MVRYVPDTTGRFHERPHYSASELDRECEKIINDFYKSIGKQLTFPITTDDLTVLIERDVSDFDPGADLSSFGQDVEGVTEFWPNKKPSIKISGDLFFDARRKNRARTTLTHEYFHARFHAYLFAMGMKGDGLFSKSGKTEPARQVCKRDGIINAGQKDWMEWQAGYGCGAFLMPITAMKNLVSEFQDQYGIYGPVGTVSLEAPLLIEQVIKTFDVSAEAAKVRLMALNYLTVGKTAPSLFNNPKSA